MRVFICFQLDTFQTAIVSSKDPDAKYYPFGEKTTLKIELECPIRVLTSFPLDTFHIPIVLSSEPEAKYSPFGENATLKAAPE